MSNFFIIVLLSSVKLVSKKQIILHVKVTFGSTLRKGKKLSLRLVSYWFHIRFKIQIFTSNKIWCWPWIKSSDFDSISVMLVTAVDCIFVLLCFANNIDYFTISLWIHAKWQFWNNRFCKISILFHFHTFLKKNLVNGWIFKIWIIIWFSAK